LNDPYSRSKADAERLVLAAHAGEGSSGMATIALRPNGIFGPGEQHHTPKLLTTAALGGSGALMGSGALTDFSHRDNVVWAVLRAYGALRAPAASRARVGGRAFFVTDGWPCHTLEQFAPLLGALAFPAPYRAAVATLPAPAAVSKAAAAAAESGAGGSLALKAASPRAAGDCGGGGSSSPLLAYLAAHPEAWQAAQAARALRVPLRVWETSVRCGEAEAITPEWSHGASHEAAACPPAAAAADPLDSCPAFLRHALGEEAAGSQQLLLTAEDTFPRTLPVPDALVTMGAALLQAAAAAVSLLTLGCLRPEPFLTLADSRKVLRHNYYSCAAAAEELGYAPLTRPAAGIAEVIAFQRAAGASGGIRSPPLAVWVAVVLGLGLTAALAYNWGGLLGAALQAGCAALLGSNGAQSSGTGLTLLPAGRALHPDLDCSPGARGGLTTLVAYLVKAVFWGAMLCHGLQGLWAFRYARTHRQAAMAWALQTTVCGFGSSQLLVASCGHSARAVPALCISLFVVCMPGVALADWLCGGALFGR
jgi:nucleoside-diphosphate-sugar epimerase